MTHRGWEDVLGHPSAKDHIVQLYEDERFLYDAVSHYLAAAHLKGASAVVIATPAHAEGFRAALAARGVNVLEALRRTQFTILDARQTLSSVLSDGWPDPERFENVIGAAFRKSGAGNKDVIAYGDMVDLLYQEGNRPQAARLEELWNDLAESTAFTLLCSYRLSNFGSDAGSAISPIAGTHSHLIPVRNYARLETAFEQALEESLGSEGSVLRALLTSHPPALPQMPPSETALLWLHHSLPTLARRVHQRTGELYRDGVDGKLHVTR